MTGGEEMIVTIEGMTCSHCALSVKTALQKIPGVASAHVDLEAGHARIQGAGLDETTAREAIESIGYTVRGMERVTDTEGSSAGTSGPGTRQKA